MLPRTHNLLQDHTMISRRLAASLAFSLAALGATYAWGESKNPKDDRAADASADVHDVFTAIAKDFRLSANQLKKVADLEAQLAKEFKAQPDLAPRTREAFKTKVMPRFRALLTGGQQAVYDLALDEKADKNLLKTLQNVQKAFFEIGHELGELSESEQTRVDVLLKTVAKEFKADPKNMPASRDDFFTKILPRFRAALSAKHQAQYDAMLKKQMDGAQTMLSSVRLRNLMMTALIGAQSNRGLLPANLGALAVENTPETFLIGGSKTPVPADFAKKSAKEKADWANQNTDFVYLGGGQNANRLNQSFVLAYIKPELAKDGNHFVLADCSVQNFDAATSAKIIAELQAGQNPAPSLKRE